MRALPAVSFEYFESTALGKIALPVSTGATGAASFASLAAGLVAAGLASAAGAAGAAAGASAAHWVLRKSFHFWPLRGLASFACLYFALHSCLVSACAGKVAANAARPETTATQNNFARKIIIVSPEGHVEKGLKSSPRGMQSQSGSAHARQKYSQCRRSLLSASFMYGSASKAEFSAFSTQGVST